MAASKAASGKWERHGVKGVKVKQGSTKKKWRLDSELEDGVVRARVVGLWGKSTGLMKTSRLS